MRSRTRIAVAFLGIALVASFLFLGWAHADQVHRNGFEIRDPAWIKGASDAPYRESAHDVTELTAHTGQLSEHIQLTVETGGFIHYYYPVGRAAVSEELTVSLWLKANRPGLQIGARIVLPRERNPQNLDEPLTTLIVGDAYQLVGRWQRLELRRPVKLTKERQQLLRAELKRDVDFTDAYFDRVVLNLYAGPGLTEAWIDDLEIGPVQEATPFKTTSRPVTPRSPGAPGGEMKVPARAAMVEFKDRLLVNSKPFFFRGIRHSDTPLKALRDAGFNSVWLEYNAPPALIEEALSLGFWLVPSLPVTSPDPRLTSSANLMQEVTRFLDRDAVLFWDLGGGLAQEQSKHVEQAISWIHGADPRRPVGADVWDGFNSYSRRLDLVGAHRWPLMTNMELSQYRAWLEQRRLLARPGAFLWTWVQTHLPDWYTNLVYDRPSAAGFEDPIGPQPEQIRLLTYLAVAAGARGLGFWSDRFLADSHQGRDRLLEMALLNQELRMLEPILSAAGAPTWIGTSHGDVQAAVFRTDQGVFVLPIWMGRGGQFVPGQSTLASLTITVPQVPVGTQVWEMSPVALRSLKTERVPGGTKITIPEFGLVSMVLFTNDIGPDSLVVRLQDQTRVIRRQAAQWSHDLAAVQMQKVGKIQGQLQELGRSDPSADKLIEKAQSYVKSAADAFNRGDYREAYDEAQRAMRPLRILMRAQWVEAAKSMDTPTASPYTLSYFTLPAHWRWMDKLRGAGVASNILPGGGFEQPPDQINDAWAQQIAILDDVETEARRDSKEAKEGKQCLRLELKPKGPGPAPAALERAFLAINSPVVHLTPGTPVKISGWIKIPDKIKASVDGALFYDSIGGEPLAVRLTRDTDWKQFTLYRVAPPSGECSVTVALTGLGVVYFDDIRVEPLTKGR